MSARPHVVVIGGGFGGLQAVRNLKRAPVRVTLLDQHNHHLFQPLLYQVATAGLSVTDIAAPLRHLVRKQANTTVLLGRAEKIDVARRTVVLDEGELVYDHLIVAAGAVGHWFGHTDWARHALGLKDSRDALEIRSRLLLAFETAERTADERERKRLLTFAIVGGGPTGVELAGAVADIARVTLVRDFRNIDPAAARVVLIEAAPRILLTFPEELSRKAAASLERFGVEVRASAPVTAVDEHGLVAGGERLEAATVLWAAGVRATPLTQSLGAPLDRSGRVLVRPDLTVPDHPEIQVVGDAAAVPWRDGTVPGMAPGAIQMGRHAARNVVRATRGDPPLPFVYRDKGQLATVGRSSAVAQLGRLDLAGFPAWVLWAFVHIFYLIGFRNRFAVMFEWAWLYLTRQRGSRVILNRRDVHPRGAVAVRTGAERVERPAPEPSRTPDAGP